MYRNIICFFSFLFFSFYRLKCTVGEEWERKSKTAEYAPTHRVWGMNRQRNYFCLFCFVLPGLKSSLIYIIFTHPRTCTPSYAIHATYAAFLRGTACVLFNLGNRQASCYATHAIYAACQKDISVNMQYALWINLHAAFNNSFKGHVYHIL